VTLVPQEPLTRLASFARLLRDTGLSSGPDRLLDACAALQAVDMASREEVRDALRAVFICRHEEAAIFDTAFDAFWTASAGATTGYGSGPRPGRSLPIDPRYVNQWMAALGLVGPGLTQIEEGDPAGSAGYSPSELLRQRDFGDLGWEEMQAVRRLLRQIPWKVAERRTRRLRRDRRGAIELRRTMRAAARQGGEALRVARARPRRRRRPIVVICDVSGSMDRYSRQLLVFIYAVSRRERVEAFAFSTGLTRITHLLRHGDIDAVLDQVSGQVHDIGGGTRIADALHEFHRTYARRVLGHGAVVLLISDGWDRGDPEALGQEMARLRRSCHRLVWLNPLLGGAGYTPETRGMMAALPHCDDFLAAHNVEALDELGRLLAALPARVSRGGGGATRQSAQGRSRRPPSQPTADAR
jgi:uncharacterized protein